LPSFEKSITTLTSSLGSITSSFISITTSVVGAIITFFTVLVLAIYFLVDEQIFTKFLLSVTPDNKEQKVTALINKISNKIGEWVRGQLLLGLVIGVIVYIGLSIIGIKYALTLAVISGVLEILPIIGPIISGVLAALVGLSVSPITALIVIIFYILVQQLENNLVVPKLMAKAVGLPPAIIIIAILVGGKLLGVIGALLAVPVAAIAYVIFEEWGTIRQIIAKP
jgi:predicted PurR-regulated permease PerM